MTKVNNVERAKAAFLTPLIRKNNNNSRSSSHDYSEPMKLSALEDNADNNSRQIQPADASVTQPNRSLKL